MSVARTSLMTAGRKAGIGVVELGDAWGVDALFELVEHAHGELFRDRAGGHEVVGLERVAALGDGHAGLGEGGLKGHDGGGLLSSLAGRGAREGEHFGNVGDVVAAQLLVLGAGAQVEVALGHAEAALVDDGNLLGSVGEVLLLAVVEEDVDADALEPAGEAGEREQGHAVDFLEHGGNGREAVAVDGGGVHAGVVKVTNFLLVGGAGGAGGFGFLENAAELLRVDVLERVEAVIAGLIGGDGMVGGVVAAGECVEIVAGVGGGVD